jgi:hypothetical protein
MCPKGKASVIDRSAAGAGTLRATRRPVPQHRLGIPLSVELESASWPRRFNANTLPQYDGDYDPKEFLMKFEAAVESNGGDATTKAKALVMALKGEVQYWYANIPKGHITSWFQLHNKLLSSFEGM